MNLITGNAYDSDTNGTGWFLGYSLWTRLVHSDLLHVPKEQLLSGLCVKWYDHQSGHDSGNSKPVSEGRTISILVSQDSVFRVEFCETPDFEPTRVKSVVLQRHGDFVIWGEDLFHRWHCLTRSTILTLRWNPNDSNVVASDTESCFKSDA